MSQKVQKLNTNAKKSEIEELFGDIDGITIGVDTDEEFTTYPFHCPPLDIPFGGGVVSGKIIELFGEESHGKSSFALEMGKVFARAMETTKENYYILWVESESAFDSVRAQYMGFPIHRLIKYTTDIFEDGRDKIKEVLNRCAAKKVKLFIVWDTIAAVVTKNEKEALGELDFGDDGDDGDKKKVNKTNPGGMMEKPRLLKQMLRDITVDLGNTHSTMVLVNQVIDKHGSYIKTVDTTGGRGLRHFASVRARLVRVDDDTNKDGTPIAIVSEISFAKNKLTGFTKYKIPVYINLIEGVDYLRTRLIYLKSSKLLGASSGSWTTFKIPVGYATKPVDDLEMIEVKFQGEKGALDLTKSYPHLIDWWDYLIYKRFADDMPLVKAKNIDKVWEYENKFFGKRITKLTEKERNASVIMFADLIKQSDVEEKAVEPILIGKNNATKK